MARATLIALIVLASLTYLHLRPTAEQQAILAEVATQVERSGVDEQLAARLQSLEPTVIYIATHSDQGRRGDAEIAACTFPGAVGISVAAFRDQMARFYVSRGPVMAPNSTSYMIYLAR